MKIHVQTLCLCLLVGLIAVPLPSMAVESGGTEMMAPYFFVEGGESNLDRFPLKSTDVKVNIRGVIADVRVTQRYTNQGGRPINGRYIFPASTRAAVHGMTMTIGERVIRAEIKRKEKAKAIFNEAKKSGKSASLLSQQRPNVFSMEVANIMPGDTIDIELHYSELLVPEEKVYSFVFPTVVGPRYSSGSVDEKQDKWIANPYLKEGVEEQADFTMEVRLATGIPIKDLHSSSHKVDNDWQGASEGKVTLAASELHSGNRDYILQYRLAGEQISSGLMLYEGEEENYFLLMVQPPERLVKATIPAREYLFVVDVSGSMHGFPLDTAKEMLRDLIGNLNSGDMFNVLLFAGGSNVMEPRSVPANNENIIKALRFIDNEQGGGGTELSQALRRGLALPVTEGFSRTMLVVTDGYIQAEKESFRLIQENLNKSNLFAFGIGSSVNRYLIEGLAKAGLGEPFIVTGPSDAPAVAEKFRRMVSQPVLTNIQVDYSGIKAYDVEPSAIPDLFADRPVVIFGKWQGERQGSITLNGTGGGGKDVKNQFSLVDSESGQENEPLRTLWARQRLMRISDYFSGFDDENIEEIATLGLKYNLLTSETSFVAVHEVVRNTSGAAADVKQPLPLPKGVSNMAVGSKKTPEPELWLMLIGVFATIFVLFRRNRRSNSFGFGGELK
ncbi:MAG: VIT and VWA domain-containing protein [Desulfobulbaceae bacterium]|nr:VIT and VWA domain-containing protein [Desulfobulbaceae bacterium]